MLSTLLLFLMVRSTLLQGYNVYYMYSEQLLMNNHQLMFDCLPYYVDDRMISYGRTKIIVSYEIIHYCFRPLEGSHYNSLNFSKTRDPHFTFNQLRTKNVSSDQLYLWSAPIDVIEEYEIYLNTNISSSTILFYNCTDPYWFGPFCQYSFDMNTNSQPFTDIVEMIFDQDFRQLYSDLDSTVILSYLSCYMHVPCNRGGQFPACLDWREICDGKIDCIDGGSDEKNCDELEINECKDNEYRCHNGQCIPEDFFRDNILNPDCIDGTDEFAHTQYPSLCAYDPTYRCENIRCRPSTGFNINCGDGQCTSTKCVNRRDLLLRIAMFMTTLNINNTCRNLMACLTGLDACDTLLNISEYCPETFQFPDVPVLFGHVKLFYINVQSNLNPDQIILPTYICYDSQLCTFVSTNETTDNSTRCKLFSKMFLQLDQIKSWNDLLSVIQNLFHLCSLVPDGYCQHKAVLYKCKSTEKCISKYRLMDQIQDCLLNDDEQYSESCSLPDTIYRFSCVNGCLSPITHLEYLSDCSYLDIYSSLGLVDPKRHIFFQTICDGFTELNPPLHIDGQYYTDETECDFWPCVNIYTRCNGIWNCKNGIDEVNCSPSPCPPFEHMCVSPVNNSLFCLPIQRVADGIVDCLGASDERQICRKQLPSDLQFRFWCRNKTGCISADYLCDDISDCDNGDDEQFCSQVKRKCKSVRSLSPEQEFLCNLDDTSKTAFVSFSLQHSCIYPKELETLNFTQENEEFTDSLVVRKKRAPTFNRISAWLWRCHRGLPVFILLEDDNRVEQCLCPPGYYGEYCQYQNQRASITLQVRATFNWRLVFTILFTLIDDDEYNINSYDTIEYLPFRDCGTKFNVDLLYSARPKNISKNYSVRIDVFIKDPLEYRASWLYPIQFSFLPVYRMALQILLPFHSNKSCSLVCGIHGQCSTYINTGTYFCHCDHRWSGARCDREHVCNCSSDSLCIGPSICLCPLHRFGPRCYLKKNYCLPNPCLNDGVCVSSDKRKRIITITCICPEDFSGKLCQYRNTKIDVTLRDVTIPSSIIIHYIEVFDKDDALMHRRSSSFKKIGIYENSFTIYRTSPFHVMFIELFSNYYLTILKETFIQSRNISTDVISSQRCSSINELFNESFTKLHLIRRIKYYHMPCEKRLDLTCFYDDTQMCLCNFDRHANCFKFDQNMTYRCRDVSYCDNGGRCFQDDSYCPKTIVCLCLECYYGSRCQFSTKGINLALDIIIGYHILQNVNFIHQSLVVKISTILTMVIIIIGIVNSILSIITFQKKHLRNSGCGIYLLISSITSILAMILLAFKFWFLFISQMGLITNRTFLKFTCIPTDYFLRVFVTITEWFYACVATERVFTVIKGTSFNKLKSKRTAKWVIMCIVVFITSTLIQDPIHRRLIDDEEEHRTWCVAKYSASIQIFDFVLVFIHFLTPFLVNIISALLIIIATAQRRSKLQKKVDHVKHLRQELQQHKHLLISPCALIVLAVPRLIISFLSSCMKSTRDPWLFLIGYFVSFIPPALNFIVFVLPSKMYMREFRQTVNHIRRIFASS